MDIHHGSDSTSAGRTPGHEPSDVNVRLVFVFGLALVFLAIVVHFTLGALMRSFSDQRARPAGERPITDILGQSTEPRLQDNPADELAAWRSEEEKKLNTYGWIDRKAGAVRIPIDRAIDVILMKGLPTRPSGFKAGPSTED